MEVMALFLVNLASKSRNIAIFTYKMDTAILVTIIVGVLSYKLKGDNE